MGITIDVDIHSRYTNLEINKHYSHYFDEVNIMKEKISDPSQRYITFATIPNGGNVKVLWYINGKSASEEEVRAITVPSYWNKSNLDVFDVKLENLISVGE